MLLLLCCCPVPEKKKSLTENRGRGVPYSFTKSTQGVLESKRTVTKNFKTECTKSSCLFQSSRIYRLVTEIICQVLYLMTMRILLVAILASRWQGRNFLPMQIRGEVVNRQKPLVEGRRGKMTYRKKGERRKKGKIRYARDFPFDSLFLFFFFFFLRT